MTGKRVILLSVVIVMVVLLLPGGNGSLLAVEKTANLVTLEWPPYLGSNLKNQGFVAEVVREAFTRAGYQVTIDFLPWNRAFSLTKRGDYDGLVTAYFVPDRLDYFNYHQEPIAKAEVVLMELEGRGIEYQELEDLKSYKIGVRRGFAHPAEFDAADYLNKIQEESTVTLLRMLLGSRFDLIVEDKNVLLYKLEKEFEEGLARVNVVEPPLGSEDLFIAFNADIPKEESMLTDFNAALMEIKEDGTYAEILDKHQIK